MRDHIQVAIGAMGPYFGFSGGLLPERSAHSVATLEEIGLVDAASAATDLFELGSALSTTLDNCHDFVTQYPNKSYDRWKDIAALCQSAGSSFELVVAALRDTSGMMSDLPLDSDSADRLQLALAAFLDQSAGQYLISAGHNLANIALRVCVDDPTCCGAMNTANRKIRAMVSGVLTGERNGWIYLSDSKQISQALNSGTPEARLMHIASAMYDTSTWQDLNNSRGEYFHRWRQTFKNPSATDLGQIATALHGELIGASQLVSRAVPDFYHRLAESFPRSVDTGQPIMSVIYDDNPENGTYSPAVPDVPFTG